MDRDSPHPRLDIASARGGMGVPPTPLLSRLARCESPVQADGPGCGVGGFAAGSDDVDLHDLLRRARPRRLRRAALSSLLVHGSSPVDVFRVRTHPVGKQPRGVLEPHQEGLLPPADHSDRLRSDGFGRFRRCFRRPDRIDGLVPGAADPHGDLAAPSPSRWAFSLRSASVCGWPLSMSSIATSGTSCHSSSSSGSS